MPYIFVDLSSFFVGWSVSCFPHSTNSPFGISQGSQSNLVRLYNLVTNVTRKLGESLCHLLDRAAQHDQRGRTSCVRLEGVYIHGVLRVTPVYSKKNHTVPVNVGFFFLGVLFFGCRGHEQKAQNYTSGHTHTIPKVG